MFGRLATREDARFGHVHKLAGLAVLGHYAWRVSLWATTGTTGLDRDAWTPAWLLLHAMLHVTSFQFHVDGHRNRTYNIIWPEMRLHTAAFAARSIVVAAAVWLTRHALALAVMRRIDARWLDVLDTDSGATAIACVRAAAVLGTLILADAATVWCGDGRTTTMRDNPYPSNTPWLARRAINLFYSVSQIAATVRTLVATSVEPAFFVLLPIQIAPLLMTLVRKGYLRQTGWHIVYSLSLLGAWWHAVRSPRQTSLDWQEVALMVTGIAALRLRLGINKYLLWTAAAAYAIVFGQQLPM